MLTLYNFGDHRLHTYGERRFIDRRSCWPMENAASSTGDHVDLCIPTATTDYAHGDRRFIDRRSCWPCITSATSDYTHMENTASSIDDHVDLWRTPLHQLAIMLTFTYLRRPPTTHAWTSPFHHRRPPTTHAWRSSFHRPAVMLTFA